jgi:hypothetical protein
VTHLRLRQLRAANQIAIAIASAAIATAIARTATATIEYVVVPASQTKEAARVVSLVFYFIN